MAFICLSDKVSDKSFTSVENKFITKYMPVLDPVAVKVYLYALYLCKSSASNFTVGDLGKALELSEEQTINYFEYLEEYELIKITSFSPFEAMILDCENISGTPKKIKPEKYADFTRSAQALIKGRMISTNEFREYFYLLEEYSFDQNALLMIISYCVNLKGDNIRFQYIKKVAKSFAEEGATTADKVNEKLSSYTSSTPALIRIYSAAGISRQPDIDDDKLYKKWSVELGFDDEAIIAAAKYFKAKTADKLDAALNELYKNRKFDIKEIEDYCKNKNSIYTATVEIARLLGVYMKNSAPYIETYSNVWCNYGYSLDALKNVAVHCFRNGKNSFEEMNGFITELLKDGIVDDSAVKNKLETCQADDELISKLISACGLSRKIIDWDRDNLARWRDWGFNNEMLLKAASLSSGKNNPFAYMNGILSAWKAGGIFSGDKIDENNANRGKIWDKAAIESHYSELRHTAEERADKALNSALADSEYSAIHQQLNSLAIKLAFAEIKDESAAKEISAQISQLEKKSDERLAALGIDKKSFAPHYSCKICGDTGYDKNGKPCVCLKRLTGTI